MHKNKIRIKKIASLRKKSNIAIMRLLPMSRLQSSALRGLLRALQDRRDEIP